MEGEAKWGRGGVAGKKPCYQRRHGPGLNCLCFVVWQLSVCDMPDIYLWPGSVSRCPVSPHHRMTTRLHHPLSKVTVCPGSPAQRSLAFLLLYSLLQHVAFRGVLSFRQFFCPIFSRFSKKTVWPNTSAHHGLEQIRRWQRCTSECPGLLELQGLRTNY